MIVVITSTAFRSPQTRDVILSALIAAEARAPSETGVVAYRVPVDPHSPLRTHALEIYESEDALRNHLNSPGIHELTSATDDAEATLDLPVYQRDLNWRTFLSG